jgi:hypothetical protein
VLVLSRISQIAVQTKDPEQILSFPKSSHERVVCKRVYSIDFYVVFLQSRARCQDRPGTLLSSPCVKLKDETSQQKMDVSMWTTAQVPQRATSSVGISSSAWKGKKYSDMFQAMPNCVGYVEPLEDCK